MLALKLRQILPNIILTTFEAWHKMDCKKLYSDINDNIANNIAKDTGIEMKLLHSDKHPVGFNASSFRILIEGNIGAGKTSLSHHLASHERVTIIEEPVNRWRNFKGRNMLDLLYSDPKKYAFDFQSMVLETICESYNKHANEERICIFERSAYSSRYVFGEKLFVDGDLNEREYQRLDALFEQSVQFHNMSNVGLIIYLKTTPQVSWNRMKQRDRSEESLIALSFLKELDEFHDQWLVEGKFSLPCPVLYVNADGGSKESVYEAIKQVTKTLFR